jgi:hypothetical protein
MCNIKYEVKIITVENIKICRCFGDHVSFELAAVYVSAQHSKATGVAKLLPPMQL